MPLAKVEKHNEAAIKAALKKVKSRVESYGGKKIAAKVEKAVIGVLKATQSAANTRWVRGRAVGARPRRVARSYASRYGARGGRGGSDQASKRAAAAEAREAKAAIRAVAAAEAKERKAAAAAEAKEKKEALKAVADAIAAEEAARAIAEAKAAMEAAAKATPETVASDVEALMSAALVYKRVTQFGNALEVRLSQIDEHGFGLYTMTDIPDGKKICLYGGTIMSQKIPEDAPYTVVPIGNGGDLYIDPSDEERNVGRYAYPCEHIPAPICNAKLVVDDTEVRENMMAYLVATRYIIAGSEIFVQWVRGGAHRFSYAMIEKVAQLAEIENIYAMEAAQLVPTTRGFMAGDHVNILLRHVMNGAVVHPRMHLNPNVLPVFSKFHEGEGEFRDEVSDVGKSIYAMLSSVRQMPRGEATVMIVGGHGHYVTWEFVRNIEPDTEEEGLGISWRSYMYDTMTDGSVSGESIRQALGSFVHEAAAHGLNISDPVVINLGWQGVTPWSGNACGAFSCYVARQLMTMIPVGATGPFVAPTWQVLESMMHTISKLMAIAKVQSGMSRFEDIQDDAPAAGIKRAAGNGGAPQPKRKR